VIDDGRSAGTDRPRGGGDPGHPGHGLDHGAALTTLDPEVPDPEVPDPEVPDPEVFDLEATAPEASAPDAPAHEARAAEATAPEAATPEALAPPTPAPSTVAELIAGAAHRAGARWAFTVPGETFLPLLEALPRAGIRVVATRHEGAAAFMAGAMAQLTARPQLVLATRTVGAANAAIGIHAARQDSAPVIAVVGDVERAHRGREAFQESDLVHGLGSLAKWAAALDDPGSASAVIADALRRATTGRPGPVLLAVPEDVFGAVTAGGAPHGSPSGPGADRGSVRTILRWLAASERGAILAGGGVLRARSSRRLAALADALAVPVIAAWRRPDVIANDHPSYLGMTGYWAAPTVRPRLEAADVLLVIGCRLNEIASYGWTVPTPGTRWAHVDLEPRSGADLPPPDLAVAADAGRFLDAAWADLRAAVLDAEMRDRRLARLEQDRAAWEEASRVDAGTWDGPGVHPGRVIAALQRVLPPEATVTTDAGNFGGWLARGFRFTRPGTFLGPTSGAMGYGLPAAIAASLHHPDRPAIAVCGDGGFAMTMGELETAVREGARPVALVFDDRRYGTVAMHQDRAGLARTAAELGPIDAAAVAEACGAKGYRVTTDAEVEGVLREALATRRAAVVHLPVDQRWVSVDDLPTPGGEPPDTPGMSVSP
jgi:acetolactate synthase-1/2/3 large subunit